MKSKLLTSFFLFCGAGCVVYYTACYRTYAKQQMSIREELQEHINRLAALGFSAHDEAMMLLQEEVEHSTHNNNAALYTKAAFEARNKIRQAHLTAKLFNSYQRIKHDGKALQFNVQHPFLWCGYQRCVAALSTLQGQDTNVPYYQHPLVSAVDYYKSLINYYERFLLWHKQQDGDDETMQAMKQKLTNALRIKNRLEQLPL